MGRGAVDGDAVTDFGWSWADPIADLVIAGVAVSENVQAWRGDTCCTPVLVTVGDTETPRSTCSDGCCAPDASQARRPTASA